MEEPARDPYLELLKQRLTRADTLGEFRTGGRRHRAVALVMQVLAERGLMIVPTVPSAQARSVRSVPGLPGSPLLVRMLDRRQLATVPDESPRRTHRRTGGGLRGRLADLARIEREFGLDWPANAESMSRLRRIDNVADCIIRVVEHGIPGDLIETAVRRGGTAIFMRAVLAAHGETGRRVWAADSFAGLPKPDVSRFPADEHVDYTIYPELSVGLQQVKANFARYGMLDEQVEFLQGWFRDTLPSAPIERLAVLPLDGDMYESTMDALQWLYPKLSPRGYCIVDDFGASRRAVEDNRSAHGIAEEIHPVDWTCVYWRRGPVLSGDR